MAGDPCHSRQPRQLESAAESWAETRRAAEQPRSSCRVRRCCCWPNSLCRSAECLPCLPAAAALVGSSCIEPAAARPPPSLVPRLGPHRCCVLASIHTPPHRGHTSSQHPATVVGSEALLTHKHRQYHLPSLYSDQSARCEVCWWPVLLVWLVVVRAVCQPGRGSRVGDGWTGARWRALPSRPAPHWTRLRLHSSQLGPALVDSPQR